MLIKQMLSPGWIPIFNCCFNSVAKQQCKSCKKQLLSGTIAVNRRHLAPRLSTALLVFNSSLAALILTDNQRWFKLTLFTFPGHALGCILIYCFLSAEAMLTENNILCPKPVGVDSRCLPFFTPFIFSSTEVRLFSYTSLG